MNIKRGDQVTIPAPEGHPLHGVAGVVTWVESEQECWELNPVNMMNEPLTWTPLVAVPVTALEACHADQ